MNTPDYPSYLTAQGCTELQQQGDIRVFKLIYSGLPRKYTQSQRTVYYFLNSSEGVFIGSRNDYYDNDTQDVTNLMYKRCMQWSNGMLQSVKA